MLPSCLQVLMSRSGSRESLPGFSYDAGECNGSGVPCNFAACPCVLHSGFPVAERDRLLQLGWHFDIHSYMRADFVCRRNRKRQLCVNASVREHGEFVLCVPGHSSEYPNLEQAECTLPRLVDLVAACVCVLCVCAQMRSCFPLSGLSNVFPGLGEPEETLQWFAERIGSACVNGGGASVLILRFALRSYASVRYVRLRGGVLAGLFGVKHS